MMKKRILIIIIIGVIILAGISLWIYSATTGSKTATEKSGRCDLLLYTYGDDNTIQPLDLSVDNQEVKEPPLVYFKPLKNAYLYLLLFYGNTEMTVLFPGTNGNFPWDYQFKKFFLPQQDNNWQSWLKSPGQYTLCVFISSQQEPAIARLMSRYAAGRESIASLQAEIAKRQRDQQWSKNTNRIPEWISGTRRSAEKEVLSKAWSIPFRECIVYNLNYNYTPGEKHD